MKRTYLYPLIRFATTVIGACVTYWMGLRSMWKDLHPAQGTPSQPPVGQH